MKELDQMHAGHYWPVGGNESVRFDEDNVHGQCVRCNYHEHGNLVGYTYGIIAKIGKERYEVLGVKRHNRSKMMAFEINLLIDQYTLKVAELKSGITKNEN